MAATVNRTSVEKLNQANIGKLPEHIGLEITEVADGKVVGRFPVRAELVAHTGFLLAGAVLSVADILCAYGVSTAWPEGASGFTTAEVKCNFVGTLREGEVICTASLLHGGRTTQVWDARVEDAATGKLMAAFRCTQVILYPRA
ncbi:PaaI family thioesterase [Phenylobacterium aquaticum]|uniref:PaaI family thioesterase n=1 Tax=Phenylobacterium aquaticum TaxID=1763816 RepID=UPI001F5C62E6|nr:PaaI family thioesterase [Phenylobacterium aquaticum]MCI3131809.1 PaaI family thioesterase [Phenylobacterium aquaticum]